MSPLDYCAALKSFELQGLMIAEAGNHEAVRLCDWIRPRVRRSDFVGVHGGAAVVVVKQLRHLDNLDSIAARLAGAANQPAADPKVALRLGAAPFESGRAPFEQTWGVAWSALRRANEDLPYVVARDAPKNAATGARNISWNLGILQHLGVPKIG